MFSVEHYIVRPPQKLTVYEFIDEYRRLYQAAQEVFDEYNPCDVQDGVCLRGRSGIKYDNDNFCCAGCDWLTDTGCSVEALWCKMWTCRIIITGNNTPQDFRDKLNAINHGAGTLLKGVGGRRRLEYYIAYFYGEEALKEYGYENERSQEVRAASSGAG